MKIPKMNLSKFLYLNSLILLTWYQISISHILLSPIYFLCFNHTIVLVLCLCALIIGIIILLVYSIYLFSFNPIFYIFFIGFFSNFYILILFLFYVSQNFLLLTVINKRERKIINLNKTKSLF